MGKCFKGKNKKSAFCEMGENKSKLQSDIGDENLKNTLNKSIYCCKVMK